MAHRTSDGPIDAEDSPGTAGATGTVTREAVLDRLDRVDDPELDRSIVELEYVDTIRIDPPELFVRFKLPTAWCSPAFAWMMATGIREEGEKVAGIERTGVELIDHMHTEEINAGVNGDRAFEDAFEDASEGIEETRRGLDRKARLARQYRAVEALLDAGLRAEQIVSLTPADLGFDDLDLDLDLSGLRAGRTDESGTDEKESERDGEELTVEIAEGAAFLRVPRAPIAAYLVKAVETGLLDSSEEPLFATPEGEAIDTENFDLVHHRARAAKVNQSGQGGVCASLHESRYGTGGGEESEGIDEPAD